MVNNQLEIIKKVVNDECDVSMIVNLLEDMSQDFSIVSELNNMLCLAMEIIREHKKDVPITKQRELLLELVDSYTLPADEI